MDQDAFRNLLAGSRRSQPNAKQGVPTNIPQKPTTSQPAFKPRKVKKTEGKYRDRAAERREGTGNDYAQVEAVLEDFERRVVHENKDVIEQQRKYLGGDSQHTILVKGLDMSLLEQNRVRAVASTEDDEILEQAFTETTSTFEPTEPRKRTREDIIRDLKAKQQNGDTPVEQQVTGKSEEEKTALEAAKRAGKFRPIGFKPVGQTEEKTKKRKVKEGKEDVKKKKQKVAAQSRTQRKSSEEMNAKFREQDIRDPSPSKTTPNPPELEPEPAPPEGGFDIFADAGDYEGFPAEEESGEELSDEEETRAGSTMREAIFPAPAVGTKGGWFEEPELETRRTPIPSEESRPIPEVMEAEKGPQEVRLQPLESSALPSIRDFLAMDEAVGKAEKRKARKEKKKKKKAGEDDDD